MFSTRAFTATGNPPGGAGASHHPRHRWADQNPRRRPLLLRHPPPQPSAQLRARLRSQLREALHTGSRPPLLDCMQNGLQTTPSPSVPLEVMEQDALHVAKMGGWTRGQGGPVDTWPKWAGGGLPGHHPPRPTCLTHQSHNTSLAFFHSRATSGATVSVYTEGHTR